MKTSHTLAALSLVLLLGMTACNGEDPDQPADGTGAVPGTTAPQQDMDPEMLSLMMEAQELQMRLQPIQAEAMQDEGLAAQLEEIQQRVESAMQDENPELFERMQQLESDFMAAQEAGDQERVQEVTMEAQGLEGDLQALQSSVLDRPDIREPIDSFEAAQRARMIEIDPEAGDMMDRLDEIVAAMQTM
jgi:hypothetical protein